jgi:hypothetical protein
MIAAWVFFGVVGALTLNAAYHFGVAHGLRTDLASRLPGGNIVRECLLHPDQAVALLLDRIARNPVRWALGTAFSAIVVGGTLFSFVEEDVSLPDGWWWAFVSMSTVGYGDIAPHTTGIRFLATFVIATGIASTAILTAALAGRIAERRIAPEVVEATPELADDFSLLRQRAREHHEFVEEHLERLEALVSHPRQHGDERRELDPHAGLPWLWGFPAAPAVAECCR